LLYNQRVSYVSGIRHTPTLIKKYLETNPLGAWTALPEQLLWGLAATYPLVNYYGPSINKNRYEE
jgi:hypothetical protein